MTRHLCPINCMYSSYSSPLVYLIYSFYISMLCLVVLFNLSSLEIWVLIELITFTFVGLSLLSFIKYGYFSQGLISYFLLQSGFSILLFISLVNITTLSSAFYFCLVYAALLAKLGVLPLGVWVYPVFAQLNGSVLYNSMTLQNIPLFVLLGSMMTFNSAILVVSCVNLFIAGLLALSSSDVPSLIIFSSIANNSWLIISLIPAGPYLFLTFYVFYMLGLYLIIFPFSSALTSTSLLSLSGLPPFPLFFVNLFIVISILNLNSSTFVSLFLVVLLVSAVLISSSYVRLVSVLSIYSFNVSNYVS